MKTIKMKKIRELNWLQRHLLTTPNGSSDQYAMNSSYRRRWSFNVTAIAPVAYNHTMLNIGDRWWFIFEMLLTHHRREANNTSEPRPQPIGIIMDGGVNPPVHDDLILFTCEAISRASAGRLTANGIDGKSTRRVWVGSGEACPATRRPWHWNQLWGGIELSANWAVNSMKCEELAYVIGL